MRTSLLAVVLLSGCVQGVDVGSESSQLTTHQQGDGGAVGGRFECRARGDAGPGACEGPLAIFSTSEWEAFQALGCETFCGDLILEQNQGSFLVEATELPAALTDTTLRTVTGSLRIFGAYSVTAFTFQELRTADAIEIWTNEALELVNLPNLSTTNRFEVFPGAKLTELHAPALTYAGSVSILSNPNLTVLDLPSLTTVPDRFMISNNASLRQCVADAVIAGLQTPPSRSESTNNLGLPNTCP